MVGGGDLPRDDPDWVSLMRSCSFLNSETNVKVRLHFPLRFRVAFSQSTCLDDLTMAAKHLDKLWLTTKPCLVLNPAEDAMHYALAVQYRKSLEIIVNT